jgi:hypothetical protein
MQEKPVSVVFTESSSNLRREPSLRATQHDVDELLACRNRLDFLPSRLHPGDQREASCSLHHSQQAPTHFFPTGDIFVRRRFWPKCRADFDRHSATKCGLRVPPPTHPTVQLRGTIFGILGWTMNRISTDIPIHSVCSEQQCTLAQSLPYTAFSSKSSTALSPGHI